MPIGIKAKFQARYKMQGVTLLVKDVILVSLLITSLSLVKAQAIVQPKTILPNGSTQLQTTEITPIRGSITDRNGVVLAVTSQAHTVFADQNYVTDPIGEARKLAPLLKLDPAELAEDLTGDDVYVVLKRNVSPLVWGRIAQLKLNGIYAETTLSRVYPEGSLGANVLGFVNFEGEGAGGIENALNSVLAGVAGERRYTRVAGLETADTMIKPAEDGKHVRLTIERDIQWVAQQAIAERVKYARAESGSVIVLNVKTGEVLAMATAPSFNPNDLSTANPKNLGNRVLSNAYEPGSTGKIMTMAAVIEEGVADPESQFVVPYKIKRTKETFSDHEYHKDLKLTLTGILAQSSNVGSILASERLPKLNQTIHSYWEKFGIGQSTGLNFPGENAGSLKDLNEWNASTAPTYAFGQGYSVNALQAASIFATIANDGLRVTPSLIAGYTNNDGDFEAAAETDSIRVVSESTAKKVRLMLESVVSESGTAPNAKIPGYRVAGKTGTAEIWNNECNDYCDFMASFIGMAPADEPEIVVAVSIVKPKNGHYGGVLAGPVFKRVMSFALQQMRVPPTGTVAQKYAVKW
jgi:cell division protein FtsI (penicillin-binding protein 3)